MMNEQRVDGSIRWLAACGVVAAGVDVIVIAWLGALNPGYSHVWQYISELGESGRPSAAWFMAWCIVWGLLFVGFAIALRRGLGGRKGAWLGPGAVLIIATTSILGAFFPCDPGGTAETFTGQVHLWLGGWICVPAIMLTPFLSWVAMRGSAEWRCYGAFTLLVGATLAAVAGWLTVCHYGDVDRAAGAVGLAQRLFMGIFYLWVAAVAVRFWKVSATPTDTSVLR